MYALPVKLLILALSGLISLPQASWCLRVQKDMRPHCAARCCEASPSQGPQQPLPAHPGSACCCQRDLAVVANAKTVKQVTAEAGFLTSVRSDQETSSFLIVPVLDRAERSHQVLHGVWRC